MRSDSHGAMLPGFLSEQNSNPSRAGTYIFSATGCRAEQAGIVRIFRLGNSSMHIKIRYIAYRLATHKSLKRAITNCLRSLSISLCFLPGLSAAEATTWKELIGYDRLVSMVGSSLPNGNGVPISIVEAGGTPPVVYYPDTTDADFQADSDPLSAAVSFVDGTGLKGNGNSGHATNQANNFFGNTASVAPGANTVTVYEAGAYLSNILRATTSATPNAQDFRVQNHSWIGTYDNTPATPPTASEIANDVSALRHFDFMINRDNVTAVVGLNNNTNSLPRLLSQSYNSIAVGRTDGIHSSGLTDLVDYGLGRSKPDIVAPRTTTSAATSSLSSVATFLHSAVAGTNAAKSEVMKAILMAGATKSEFLSWTQGFDPADHSMVRNPLDETYGAGQVSAYNSYVITQGGRFAGSDSTPTPVATHGWDYQTITSGNELKYLISVPMGSLATELSILLDWNVDVSAGLNSQTLADFSLELKDSFGQSLQSSDSSVDNVEHIYLKNLVPGDYTLTLSSNMTHDFGLAWRTSLLYDFPSADFDEDGDVDGRDFLTWQRGYGTLIGASHSEGDADGDGDVDIDDIMLFKAQYGPPAQLASALTFAVPEPSSAVLLTGGLLAFLLRRRHRV
ncbi:PEP-CTERM sorting domain-containing protein [Bythopirellula polymerisocia]|uniref:Ice-binding protein C-terminal domain-containing protein n=1 Tax=Bythopirellula polymerisocia TaxID=2528003 RepID=A0A5C6D0P7_9BACT|nr:PEP-CTERM sorting domain-containing protein [Bythopirellula polymerisocia]TWU29337.1 hypothetical protein Pla144_01130 [Bythopirellula polymerisocia]